MTTDTADIEHQWLRARDLLGNGRVAHAIPLLEAATQAGHPAASFNLGCLNVFGLVDSADRNRGKSLIQKAAELGHAPAFYQLAMLELSKPDKNPDWQYANECLQKSAELKYPTALRSLAVHWARLNDEALLQLGTLCLEHAANNGDTVSLALLMHRLYLGIGCEKNVLRASAINTLLMQSNLSVDAPISQTHPHFARAPHLAELPPLPMPELQKNTVDSAIEMVSESPWIAVVDHVLSQEECHLLRYIGSPNLKASTTAAPDGQLVRDQLRTSFEVMLEEILEDINLLLIQRRMASIVDKTPAYSEYLTLLRYQPGQQYFPHRDYLPPSLVTPLSAGGSGHRESTVIAYLNDVRNGGETEFLELGKKIAPKMGRVLAFRNLHPDGSPDSRTLHAGLPLFFGTKWIVTLWIHQGQNRP